MWNGVVASDKDTIICTEEEETETESQADRGRALVAAESACRELPLQTQVNHKQGYCPIRKILLLKEVTVIAKGSEK